jgi:hypothetical protein
MRRDEAGAKRIKIAGSMDALPSNACAPCDFLRYPNKRSANEFVAKEDVLTGAYRQALEAFYEN